MSEVIVRSTHRGLRYIDGRLDGVLEPGRYELARPRRFLGRRVPTIDVVLVDMRQREFTIKGQEIPAGRAAVARVHDAEAILTNRNQLSEDILRDVEGVATGYGVEILRADVKDIVFPGNLQDIMNRVLAAQRLAEAQLVEARTKSEREALEATSRADAERVAAQARGDATRLAATADAAATRIRADAEVDALNRLSAAAAAYTEHPALLRVRELETLGALGANPAARLYIGFDKHSDRLGAD